MSVFLCKSGRHQGKWAVKFKNADGKWTTKYCASEEIALQFEGKEPQPKEPEPPKVWTVGDLVVAYHQANQRDDRTRAWIVHFLCGYQSKRKKRHIAGAGEFLRDKPVESLNRKDLETMRQNVRNSHGACNKTLNQYQSHLKAVFNWATDQELISFNPWLNFKRLPVKRHIVNVSYEDIQAVYQEARDWLKWAIKTAYCLCLRPGRVELFSLKWSAFNWNRGFVKIKQGKTGIFKTVVPPTDYLKEAHERYQADLAEGIELVCTNHGKQIQNYHWAWDEARNKAGVNLRFYDVRHLAASQMLANGADLAAVAAQLGHQNIAMTGTVYAHVMSGAQQRAAMALPLI